MRKHGKIDANQHDIVAALEAAGCTCRSLSALGGGTPDLLVGLDGQNYLLEIKTRGGTLTDEQIAFFGWWQGQKHIVRSIDDALRVVGRLA